MSYTSDPPRSPRDPLHVPPPPPPIFLPGTEPERGFAFSEAEHAEARNAAVILSANGHRLALAMDHSALPEAFEVYAAGQEDVAFILYRESQWTVLADIVADGREARFASLSEALADVLEQLDAAPDRSAVASLPEWLRDDEGSAGLPLR